MLFPAYLLYVSLKMQTTQRAGTVPLGFITVPQDLEHCRTHSVILKDQIQKRKRTGYRLDDG